MGNKNAEVLNKSWVKQILSEPVLARLGTANLRTNQPHVVPVWFEWDGDSLFISAFISTRKAREVAENPRISVLIDTERPGESARAVLLEGPCELIDVPEIVQAKATSIYTKYMGPEGVLTKDPQSWIIDPENRIIKLTPRKVFAWGPS